MRTILTHARAITDLTELELTCCRLLFEAHGKTSSLSRPGRDPGVEAVSR